MSPLKSSATHRNSLNSRSRRGIGRNVFIGVVAGLLLASCSVLGLYIYTHTDLDEPGQLEIALRLMRKGDGESATRIAKAINPKSLKKKADLSKREFLLGVSERNSVAGIVQRRVSHKLNEEAIKHLERSRDLKFPDGYEGIGNYHLGMALFDLLRWDEAKPPLEIAAERWPLGRADAIEHLIDIDLSLDKRDAESAMARIDHWRSLPHASSEDTLRATLKEIQVRYSNKEYNKVLELLADVPEDSSQRPEAQFFYGLAKRRLSDEASAPDRSKLLQEACDSFERALRLSRTSVVVRRKCLLEMGRAFRLQGKLSQAVSTLSSLRLSSPQELESLVSGLEEIDCLIDQKHPSDATDTLEHITKNFGELDWYLNSWFPFSAMRKQIIDSGNRVIDLAAYQEAARFAKYLPPFCDEIDRLRLQCRLYENWAKQTDQEVLNNGRAEELHREAAKAYESLAAKQVRLPEYMDLLWRGIENYRQAGAFQESNKMLDLYLQYESRENQPKGLLIKARNLTAMERPDLAFQVLGRIIDGNTSTPLTYDARLEAARLLAAKEEFEAAEELILQNLYYGDLSPESPVWRDSLFELGNLLFRRGEKLQEKAEQIRIDDPNNTYALFNQLEMSYHELIRGINRIEEGLRRFENDPRRLEMLYNTAKSYHMASMWPKRLLEENSMANEDTVAAWKSQRKELLNQSRNAFTRLRQELLAAPPTAKPNTNLDNFMRSSLFGEADLLYEMGEYEEAMIAYKEAANHFISEPEALEAMTQVAHCLMQLGKKAEARRVLEMSKDMLERIPESRNSRFQTVTSHDRAGWKSYIDWLLKELVP